MNMKHSTKGYILYFALFGLFVLLGVVVVINAAASRQFSSNVVGGPSFNLLDADFESKKIMLFINQAADLSARQALYEVTKNGGFYDSSPCGNLNGFNIMGLREDCLPNPYLSLNNLFDAHFGSYLKQHEDTQLPLNNYDYTLLQEANLLSIIGAAASPIEMSFPGDDQSKKLLNPSFHRLIGFDMNYLKTLREWSRKLINECHYDPSRETNDVGVDDCVRSKRKANWDLIEPVATDESIPESIATTLSLMQQSKAASCIASWNPNNPDLEANALQITQNKVRTVRDGKEWSLPTDLTYVVSMNDLPIFVKQDFEITLAGQDSRIVSDSSEHTLGSSLLFYKNSENIGLLTEDEFLLHSSTYQQLPKCFHLYFFEIDPDASWFAYDENDKSLALRQLKIRFAVLVDSFNELNLNNLNVPENNEIADQ